MIEPHGGILINQILEGNERKIAMASARKLKKIVISEEQIKEVKNIARGLLSPIKGYMRREDLESVVLHSRLKNKTVFPLPIFLTVFANEASGMKRGKQVALVNGKRDIIALLNVNDIYTYNKKKFAKFVFGTTDKKHPGVENLYNSGEVFLGGEILLIDNSKKPYYKYNLDPKETRVLFAKRGWKSIVGFQTRNVIHRGHEYLQKCILEIVDGLFVNPVIGIKKKGDFKDELIIKSYETAIKEYYSRSKVVFSILPYQMRYAGPREAVLHAIIRKNFGCTHFIVGRDHAGVGKYYGPYDAQNIFDKIKNIGIKIMKIDEAFYCKKCVGMATQNTCGHPEDTKIRLSGTYIRSLITGGDKPVPEEIMRPEVSQLLHNSKAPFI